nr:cytochrome P450 93A3-like [Tanacetum cinerariifolium]
RIIKEHEEARKCGTREVKDLLDILLDIDQYKSLEIDLTRENIKALILNLFAGGTDPSASTIEWAMAELINHPNIMKKATEEINQYHHQTPTAVCHHHHSRTTSCSPEGLLQLQ